ncbi:alpha-sarcoglycan isoform X2 [Dermacentor albipictus]|uniref:alpha-sarcoglycan isoform X2 n=1 Tax=Dermacentor albipictus TaxID=60249 RepID=UPI0038FCAD82
MPILKQLLSSAELLLSLRASAIRVSERRGTSYRTMSLLKALVSATFLLSCSCFGAKLQDFRNQVLQTTEVFHFYIDKDMFDASIDSYGRTEFRAALLGKPDLPKWMFLRQTGNSNRALLYGSYQDNGELNIEVFAINKYNYKTSLRVISLQVEKRPREALYEVEMKFLNLNIEDLFEGDWLSDLEEIFRDHLWKESPVIYVTKVASVVDIGGRVPVNPKDKEGIVVRIGGTTNFSQELRTLEVEANQLRNRVSCPRDYKRTSAEYRFRSRSFLPDWCGFRLITLPEQLDGEGMMQHQDAAFSPIPLEEDSYNPPDMGHLPRRDLLADFLLSLLLPGFVTAMLLSTLTCFMCCQHEEDVPRWNSTAPLSAPPMPCAKWPQSVISPRQPHLESIPVLAAPLMLHFLGRLGKEHSSFGPSHHHHTLLPRMMPDSGDEHVACPCRRF